MKKRSIVIISSLISLIITLAGCEMISGLLNPFAGSWKSGLFKFTFDNDKTFKLEIGSALSFKTEGTYEFDKDKIYLSFTKDSKTTFSYVFNGDKSELTLTPETEFKWFNTAVKFSKEKN